MLQVAAESVDLVNDFVYIGSLISYNGGSEAELLRHVGIARYCFTLLEKNICIHMHRHQGAPIQDLHTTSPAMWM